MLLYNRHNGQIPGKCVVHPLSSSCCTHRHISQTDIFPLSSCCFTRCPFNHCHPLHIPCTCPVTLCTCPVEPLYLQHIAIDLHLTPASNSALSCLAQATTLNLKTHSSMTYLAPNLLSCSPTKTETQHTLHTPCPPPLLAAMLTCTVAQTCSSAPPWPSSHPQSPQRSAPPWCKTPASCHHTPSAAALHTHQ